MKTLHRFEHQHPKSSSITAAIITESNTENRVLNSSIWKRGFSHLRDQSSSFQVSPTPCHWQLEPHDSLFRGLSCVAPQPSHQRPAAPPHHNPKCFQTRGTVTPGENHCFLVTKWIFSLRALTIPSRGMSLLHICLVFYMPPTWTVSPQEDR